MTVSLRSSGIPAGFRDPVFDSQDAFRCFLTALSHPGLAETVRGTPDGPPALSPAATAIALTLFDFDTPVWLDPTAGTEASEVFLRFHCGCPIVDEPGQAGFAVIAHAAGMPRLGAFGAGEVLYPDRSATLVIQLPSLDGGPLVVLRGPGIDGSRAVAPAGLPAWFWADWSANAALYPQGVDVLLVSGSAVMGLPRSVQAEIMSCTSQ